MRPMLIIALLAAASVPAAGEGTRTGVPVETRAQTAERDRERAAEQAERDRERAAEQRERELERAAEQAERTRERAAEQRERTGRQGGSVQTERTNRTVRIGSAGELDLANISGDIVIARGGGNDAAIEIVKTARGRSDSEATELLQLVHVDIVERPNRVEVRTRYPQGEEMRRNNRRNINVNVAITATVPAGTRVRARSISGSISAKNVSGETSLESVSGAVTVANGGRVSAAKSISGDVEVTEVSSEGTIEASSVSGSVLLQRVKARALDVGSISGGVTLNDVESSSVEAQTVSGDVRVSGVLAKGGRYKLSSHSGAVQIAIGGGTGFAVEATTFSGSVHSDFALGQSSGVRSGSRRSLRGVHGDGSAVLDLSSFSGSITISKR